MREDIDMRHYAPIVLFLTLIIIPAVAVTQEITVGDEFTSMPLGRNISLLEDKSGLMEIQDVVSSKELFRPSTQDVPYFAFTQSSYWARLDIISSSSKFREFIFELSYPLMDQIDFFEISKSGEIKSEKTGFLFPFRLRPEQHRHFLFPTTLKPGEKKSYYFRFKNEDRMEIPLTLWSRDAFSRKDHNEQYVMGIYCGILLFLIIFNLFLFASTREMTYFFYIAFVAAYGLFQLTQNGYVCEYVWPEFIPGQSRSIPATIALTLIATTQFTRSFLDIRNRNRHLDKVMTAVIISLALPLALQPFMKYATVITIYAVSAVLTILFVIIIGITYLLKGYRSAKFFMIAWSAILIGGIIYALKVLAVLPSNLFTNYAIQAGSLLQFVLLALGVGDRISTMKKEKEEAQAEALAAHEIAIKNLKEAARLKDEHLAEMERSRREIEALNETLKKRIEELNEANRRIRLSEERYRILVEGSKDVIFSLNENLEVLSVNRAIHEYFRIDPIGIVGRNIMDLIYENAGGGAISKRIVQEKIEEFFKTRKPITFHAEFISPIKVEPTEMQVHLEFLAMGGTNEILGRAVKSGEDSMLRCFECERQRYVIGNYLLTADDISHRITRNLRRYLEPRQVTIMRIAVREMIINAIEHGNLELSFDEKTAAMESQRYFEIIAERQRDPRFRDRRVYIEYIISPEKCTYTISDDGPGFDYRRILSMPAEEQSTVLLEHGRGIMMAIQAFDKIEFNEKGNQVTLTKLIGLRA